MTININFEGLNKILCKFGVHRWDNWDGEFIAGRYEDVKYCQDCEIRRVK